MYIGLKVGGDVGLDVGAPVGLALGVAVILSIGGAVGSFVGMKVGGSIGLNVGDAIGLTVWGAIGLYVGGETVLTVVVDLGSGADAIVGDYVIGAGMGMVLTKFLCYSLPIVEPSCCTVTMKAPPPFPSKVLDSFCLRSSPDRYVSSYSNMTVIMYLKIFSIKVTAVIVIVMLFTLALGRALSMDTSVYSLSMFWRAASLIYQDLSVVYRVNSRGGRESSTMTKGSVPVRFTPYLLLLASGFFAALILGTFSCLCFWALIELGALTLCALFPLALVSFQPQTQEFYSPPLQ